MEPHRQSAALCGLVGVLELGPCCDRDAVARIQKANDCLAVGHLLGRLGTLGAQSEFRSTLRAEPTQELGIGVHQSVQGETLAEFPKRVAFFPASASLSDEAGSPSPALPGLPHPDRLAGGPCT